MSDEAPIAISSGELTARISPLGAELRSLVDREGREYMTDADPAFWTGHAPLLFPIVGTLRDDRYRLESEEYALPRHGFARRSAFVPVHAGAAEASFRLVDNAGTRAVYPFAFALEMRFRLDGWTLHMEAHVANPGEVPMPMSFGYHPAFAWPLPGGAPKEAHRITFAAEEPAPIRRLDGATGLVLPEAEPSPVEGRVLAPAPELFAADAMIWDVLASRSLTWGAPGGASLELLFPDTPMLGIWQKPGANFLCIEPWQGMSDPLGFAGEFTDKPGIVTVEPGGERRFRLDVTVRPG